MAESPCTMPSALGCTLQIRRAQGFGQRLRGLLFIGAWADDMALLLPHCSSVHTWGMRFALDLVYLDSQGQIVKLVPHVQPWRLSWGGSQAAHTLELSAGGIQRYQLQVGGQCLRHALCESAAPWSPNDQ